MSANFGPQTPWPVLWPTDCDVSTESPTITGAAVEFATAVLWAATGQRFGLTDVTLRPCRRECRPTPYPGAVWDPWPGSSLYPNGSWASAPVIPYGGFGLVVGAGCSTCGSNCSCSWLSEIVLPAPVNSVVEVKVDGVTVSGSAYRVDNNRYLVRTDGRNWPVCQNLAVPDTAVGSFSVRAQYGEDVPGTARGPVGELACQFLKAMHGTDCALPGNVQSLVRQGVSITMPDWRSMLMEHQFGLRLVDWFIYTYNPDHIKAAARVWDVDAYLTRRPS